MDANDALRYKPLKQRHCGGSQENNSDERRNNMKTAFKILAMSLVAVATHAQAAPHDPEALQDVVNLALKVEARGQLPVAIFDLDDTVINTRDRSLRILNEFIAQPEIQARFPQEVKNLQCPQDSKIKFLMTDTLRAQNVTDPEFVKETNDYWATRFFSNESVANDEQNPGAAAYVRRLYMAGVKIVYLTGRDTGRMHDGTVENLKKLGFPLDDSRAILIMKTDVQQDDLAFKISMFPSIAQMGSVVGVFENEPANINAHHDAFPNAVAIFLDTIHSNTSVVPESGIFWVENFRF